MINIYEDNYREPNYSRLFLLFVLFLVSLYFWIGGAADYYVDASTTVSGDERTLTISECLLAGLDRDCHVKE